MFPIANLVIFHDIIPLTLFTFVIHKSDRPCITFVNFTNYSALFSLCAEVWYFCKISFCYH